jgi:hypothetical protein
MPELRPDNAAKGTAGDAEGAAHVQMRVLQSGLHDGRPSVGERGSMTKAHDEKKDLDGKNKSQGDLVDGGEQQTPEGLKRERKGPIDWDVGRQSAVKRRFSRAG